MWSLFWPVLPGLMSFPKVWMFYVHLTPPSLHHAWLYWWFLITCLLLVCVFYCTYTSADACISCSYTGATHNMDCGWFAATKESFTPGSLLHVSSHLGVIVQWTDQGHANTAWDSHPRISNGDNLSQSIHQAQICSFLVRPDLGKPVPASLLEISP